jgi:hypothetical protein
MAFLVEHNAAEKATATEKRLIAQGVRPGTARERAEKQRAEEVTEQNKWITENVGLD